ncbi:MAG: hypothetical protein ABEJ83_04495 [Candidatus Nanohaloarchaea archaeon]
MKKGMTTRGFWIVVMVIFAISAGGAVAFMVIGGAESMDVCRFWSGFARSVLSIFPDAVAPSIPCPFG